MTYIISKKKCDHSYDYFTVSFHTGERFFRICNRCKSKAEVTIDEYKYHKSH